MEKIKTFRDLKVWQRAHELVLSIYQETQELPVEEKYGLSAQLRRSAASIPTNIVEGYKRKSKKDFAHFLNIADSSLEETKYHLMLAKDLNYLSGDVSRRLQEQCDEVGRMLCGLSRSLKC